MESSDDQLMWRIQTQDDSQAFAELLGRWAPAVQRLCFRMIGDRHRAEDLTQETFTRIYARRKEYKAEAKFSTYLWRVALNLCYDELRRLQRRGESPLEEQPDDIVGNGWAVAEVSPDTALLKEERARLVREALLRLPDMLRAVVVLRHYESLKFREVAAVLGVPEGTVKSRMAEALNQLHRELTRVLQKPGDIKPSSAAAPTEPAGSGQNESLARRALLHFNILNL